MTARYDFRSLSSQDFEELVRDLLQAEWNVALESFKAGRDQGIDLRYLPADGGKTIVQCKHYVGSGLDKLLSHLRIKEFPKIARLAPNRYVLATSVGLTPGNKDELISALKPFPLGPNDILGADDLEGLLSRHPSIKKSHFKLWLTSTDVLERVLYNAERCHTDFEIERIRQKLPRFVQSSAYSRAKSLLDEGRIVVISGPPGIGKTTLAEVLLYDYLEQGFEPVVIQADIAEGKKFFRPTEKTIFYYDDFLGQTFLGDRSDYLGRNQDTAIVDFMEMISKSEHARFILTTREHILRGALQFSERLTQSSIMNHRCILALDDYSYGQKARILYNHLYFSELPQAYKDKILKDDFFLTIIKHEHYSPRIVEWLASYQRINAIPATEYRAHVTGLLENPEKIWEHAYRQQISDAARHVLVSLYTLGEWIEESDLEPVFLSLHRLCASKYNHPTTPGSFRNALRELDGGFLSYSAGRVSYINPSIREFVGWLISNELEIVEDLLNSSLRFKQIANLFKLADARPTSDLAALLQSDLDSFCKALDRLLLGPDMRWERRLNGVLMGLSIDFGHESKVEFLIDMVETRKWSELFVIVSRAIDAMVEDWKRSVGNFYLALSILSDIKDQPWFLAHGGKEYFRRILDMVLESLPYATAFDWLKILTFPANSLEWTNEDATRMNVALDQYQEDGVRNERHECTTIDDMSGLAESLKELRDVYGLNFSYEIERLEDDIAEREDNERDREEGRGSSEYIRRATALEVTDEEVRQMFNTLNEFPQE